MKRSSTGFTLIELLIVIAVIGVLVSSLVFVINPRGQLARSRDVQRRADLKSLQTALEQYHNDHGEYPKTAGVVGCPSNWCGETAGYGNHRTDYIPGLVPSYIRKLPNDPKVGVPNTSPGVHALCSDGQQVGYLYRSDDGLNYTLLSHCGPEAPNVLNKPTDPFYDSVRPNWAWRVCSGTNGCL